MLFVFFKIIFIHKINGGHKYKKCIKKRVNLTKSTIMLFKVIHKATRTKNTPYISQLSFL